METEGIRQDNRLFTQIRPISLKLGVMGSADGSAEFSQGNTKVLATVLGPVGVKTRHEHIDRTTLKVTVESFNSAPSTNNISLKQVLICFNFFVGLKDVAIAQKLEKKIHSVIFDLLHPRTLLSITIQPLSLDGSVKFFIFDFEIFLLILCFSSS